MRKEAVGLLSCIYDTQKVPNSQLDSIFSTLTHCAVNDLHWEVKIKALAFWEIFIRQQIQLQGVIDGTFPTVTFSKEKRKIVSLTPREIILRLTKILDELSARGCLGVLLACIEDDSDLSVVKATLPVIKILVAFLDKYNYWHEIQDQGDGIQHYVPANNPNSGECHMRDVSTASEPHTDNEMKNSEEIIQSIISAQDINLLAQTYENNLNVKDDQKSDIDACYYKEFAHITATIFLHKIKTTNLDEMVKMRSDWLDQTDSFVSLLNDMLYSLKIDDVNDIDCY